ncbi:helix-turn-helix domain-containing protein [Kitasatospora sp. NPDC094011]|uniref:helix-turn-helix domain-containing protein n=1 Tax=Kitasatospora sp. NPDC094011 TaxID=3364090 RepID=UPI0037F97C93
MGVETDEFAGMLRELKERSGRSYGALATRLHVSTSTLHRYCNGAAVPAEYAPVERFARACGATGEELVELHRRWIVADAARRREPGAAAPEPSVRPESVEAVPVEAGPEAAAGREAPAGAGRRRSRVLLSAVAVVAFAAAVPVLLLHGSAKPAASGAGAVPTTAPTAAFPPAPASAPTTVPTTPPSTAAGAPAAVASDPAASDDGSGAPFHVNVLTDNWGSPCGQWFLSGRAPGQVAPPPDTAAVDGWAAAQQAVPAGHLRLQLTAQGATATPVVLHAAYIEVVSSRPAPKGNAYTPGSGCGGGLTPASFAVDLDASAPRAVPVPGKEGEVKTATSDFPYRVSDTDPQVIDVDATTASQDVSWCLYLLWSSGDRQGRLRVDDHGRPFRTAGLRGAPAYFHDGKAWSRTQPEE